MKARAAFDENVPSSFWKCRLVNVRSVPYCGLRAGVDLQVGAMPGRVLRDRAILRTLRAGIGRRAGARDVPAVVGADIAAELDAGVAARDVVETFTIERADLHVLDRLGLDGKIGCLCSRRPQPNPLRNRGEDFSPSSFEPPSCLSRVSRLTKCGAPRYQAPHSPLRTFSGDFPNGRTTWSCPPSRMTTIIARPVTAISFALGYVVFI